MEYGYLIASKHLLVEYLATKLLTKGYYFYTIFSIPKDKDPLLVDAKLILTYSTHLPKYTVAKRKKAGIASVKYMRVGHLALLIATKGTSDYFAKEKWVDIREKPLCVGGYSLSVARTGNKNTFGKVSVRLHRENQRRLKRFILRWAIRRDRVWWENFIRNLRYLPFRGVQDSVFALIKFLNVNRGSFRKDKIDYKICRRTKIKPSKIFLRSPQEILDLLTFYR